MPLLYSSYTNHIYLYYIGHYYIVKLFWNGRALRGGRITVDTSLKGKHQQARGERIRADFMAFLAVALYGS